MISGHPGILGGARMGNRFVEGGLLPIFQAKNPAVMA